MIKLNYSKLQIEIKIKIKNLYITLYIYNTLLLLYTLRKHTQYNTYKLDS